MAHDRERQRIEHGGSDIAKYGKRAEVRAVELLNVKSGDPLADKLAVRDEVTAHTARRFEDGRCDVSSATAARIRGD
jgi:hypothetical protein